MSKKIFTQEEIEILSKNKYVKAVSEKAITYTNEFKIQFIADTANGKTAKEIFNKAGLDPQILGNERINTAKKRWTKAYKEKGVLGLNDTRRGNSGRPRKRELTQEELIAKQQAEIEYLKQENELLKKFELQERQVKNGKIIAAKIFETIENIMNNNNNNNIVKYKVENLCKIAGVSRSGYYRYLSRKEIADSKEEQDLQTRDIILKAIEFRGYKKGSRTIKMILENEYGIIISRKKIQRIMRKYKIVCPIRKANPYRRMAKATKEHRVLKNKLNRNFKQGVPGKVLLTDITYLPYSNGNIAYLSTIKDASTNEILSYELSSKMTLDIAINTVEKLMSNNQIVLTKDAFIHSDQGVHYTSPKFQKIVKDYGLGQSMSRRGNCWDNAPQESFFGHMKDEIDYKSCTTFVELQYVIDDYMDYYNNHRCQWNINKLTPVQYRNQLLAA